MDEQKARRKAGFFVFDEFDTICCYHLAKCRLTQPVKDRSTSKRSCFLPDKIRACTATTIKGKNGLRLFLPDKLQAFTARLPVNCSHKGH